MVPAAGTHNNPAPVCSAASAGRPLILATAVATCVYFHFSLKQNGFNIQILRSTADLRGGNSHVDLSSYEAFQPTQNIAEKTRLEKINFQKKTQRPSSIFNQTQGEDGRPRSEAKGPTSGSGQSLEPFCTSIHCQPADVPASEDCGLKLALKQPCPPSVTFLQRSPSQLTFPLGSGSLTGYGSFGGQCEVPPKPSTSCD
ncbi:hypothetical protein ACRRTK_005280 [Alexandromys fortis]